MIYRFFRAGLLNSVVFMLGSYHLLTMFLSSGVLSQKTYTQLLLVLGAVSLRMAIVFLVDYLPNKAYRGVKRSYYANKSKNNE